MKEKKAKCELVIEVRESDPVRDDRLMKFKLEQPFLVGTYRKVINLSSSPVILSLIIKLEKRVFTVKRSLKYEQPKQAGESLKKLQSKNDVQRQRALMASRDLSASKDVSEDDPDAPSPRAADSATAK